VTSQTCSGLWPVGDMDVHGRSIARDLLYAVDEAEHLWFVPCQVVVELLDARTRLPTFSTWGDARIGLPPEYFRELIDALVAPCDQPPADEALIDASSLISEGWPSLSYGEIVDWLPEEAVDRFGERWSGFWDSGTHLPAERRDELVAFLAASGISCQEDGRVLGLFADGS
jgi:hypothetical protein